MSRLLDYLQNKTKQITIMEGREKRELKELLGKNITINNFDFLSGTDGVYAVFTIKEDETGFYFSSSVLTDHLKGIENEGLKEDVITEGLQLQLEERKSKNSNRTYISVNFII